MLLKISLEQSIRVVDKLRQLVENQTFETDQNISISVTVSAGLAQWENGLSFDEIVEMADRKLYSTKELSRNQVRA